MSTAVVVGRFQTPKLHAGHKAVLNAACEHDAVLVLLAVAPVRDGRNPLDTDAREVMIEKHFRQRTYTNYNIRTISDCEDNDLWYDRLEQMCKDYDSPVLIGGRDSFLDGYTGALTTRWIIAHCPASATDLRKQVASGSAKYFKAAYREGVINAVASAWPTSFQAVDIAVVKDVAGEPCSVLMGRKRDSRKWCLPGGFVDPSDASLEDAALRELREETRLDQWMVTYPRYVSSVRVDDWRYRRSEHKIMSAVFHVRWNRGEPPYASDDLAEVKWMTFDRALESADAKTKVMLDLVIEHIDG
jgi:bifunctional NMN adenylyltransferase/nudix hydrolase